MGWWENEKNECREDCNYRDDDYNFEGLFSFKVQKGGGMKKWFAYKFQGYIYQILLKQPFVYSLNI